MVHGREVSVGAARTVLERLLAEGGEPRRIVEAEGLAPLAEGEELRRLVEAAIAANPQAAQRVREGEGKAIGPIVGHVMRNSGGRADGAVVTRLIHEALGV